MIVDSGAPLSIVSDKQLEKYVNKMELHAQEIKERSCNRRFRFGTKLYTSMKEVKMAIVMTEDKE